MALIANSTYAYVDLDDKQVFVNTDDLTDRGAWSGATAYVFRDVVSYNGANYVCLASNTNTPPDGNISDYWSTLALVRTGSSGHTADEAYALAEEALETAVEVGQSGSNYAFNLFVAGTEYTNTQAVSAVQAEAAARIFADGTVAQQGSNYAYELYLAGTNYTATAAVAAVSAEAAARIFADGTVAAQGSQYSTILRDQGTNYTDAQIAIAVFNVGNSGSEYAYNLYLQGTNYTNTQVAAEALARQNGDTAVFVSAGQNTTLQVGIESAQRIHDDGTIAQQGSYYAHQTFIEGTNYAAALVQAEAALRAAYDFAFYVAGTNYTNQQVVATQVAAGSESLALFWAGTAYTDARVDAEESVRESGDAALQTWVGTNRDMINDLASILGASFNGTFSLYMAQVRNGKPDTKITVVGGVVTGFEQSPFVWDDFTGYSAGDAPSSFNKGSAWDDESYGSITTEVYAGTVARDTLQTYSLGTIFALNDGIGFNTTGTFAEPYVGQLGVDAFDYALGTIVNPDMSGGSTWASPAIIFQY